MTKEEFIKLLNGCKYDSKRIGEGGIIYSKNNETKAKEFGVFRVEFQLYSNEGYYSWIENWDGKEGFSFTMDFGYENLIEKNGRIYIDDTCPIDVTPSAIDEI